MVLSCSLCAALPCPHSWKRNSFTAVGAGSGGNKHSPVPAAVPVPWAVLPEPVPGFLVGAAPSTEGETWRCTKPGGCWRTCTSQRRRDHRWVLFSLLMAISTFTTTSNNYLSSTALPYTYCMPSDCAGTLGYLYHTDSV